jgi:hypothetical protein
MRSRTPAGAGSPGSQLSTVTASQFATAHRQAQLRCCGAQARELNTRDGSVADDMLSVGRKECGAGLPSGRRNAPCGNGKPHESAADGVRYS